MKKFLFTLAALMMAGSLCAEEYMYIDDFEVSQAEIAQGYVDGKIPVKAHFDYYVSAWQVNLTVPEGMQLFDGSKGPDMTITYLTKRGAEAESSVALAKNIENCAFIAASTEEGFYNDGTGMVSYGAIKWAPGDYDEMFYVEFDITDPEFKGGELIVRTQPSSGDDPRGEVCPKGQDNYKTCIVTVEGAEPQTKDLTGQIVIGEPTEDGVVAISYTGDEDVTITVTVNGEEVALTDGAIQLAEGVNTITVTVEAEGYNPMTAEAEVEWYAPVVPEVTEAPVITYETTDDAVIVTAAGNGEVILYCNGQVVENPCTIARGEQDATYTFTATAQEAGKEISTITTLVVTVPAVEVGPGPEDPHMTGYWLVMLDQNNEPVWYELSLGQNGYTTTVALEYGIFGRYDHDAGYRGNVPFYFMIDGVRYGATEGEVETVLGYAMENPLDVAEGYYTVPVGYYYSLGVFVDPAGHNFVYSAQGNFTGVDELNANKAVAGVRYFNMAGQEMQEANGMTIVVTTYTDGTTSAVKVMK